jgi:hypothetical protein
MFSNGKYEAALFSHLLQKVKHIKLIVAQIYFCNGSSIKPE